MLQTFMLIRDNGCIFTAGLPIKLALNVVEFLNETKKFGLNSIILLQGFSARLFV